MRQNSRASPPFNLTGVPAISIPCGFSRDGMPIGLQLVCGSWQEGRLLQAAYERDRLELARAHPFRSELTV
jgi:Asp-tRNA(Asn)/Glu-tRNA(Gln) amidotransferase A subunit family amidase